jgi:hypothetical protein
VHMNTLAHFRSSGTILSQKKHDEKPVNVLNLHIIDLARKYHTHLQKEIEKEEAREKEWKNSH